MKVPPPNSSLAAVGDEESVAMARFLLEHEGLFVGGSSAMQCCAAVKTARRLGPGHTIVTVLCDGGHRYLGTVHKRRDTEVPHPHHARECDSETLGALRTLLEANECVAVGECGLDYDRMFSRREVQLEWFEKQAAVELDSLVNLQLVTCNSSSSA